MEVDNAVNSVEDLRDEVEAVQSEVSKLRRDVEKDQDAIKQDLTSIAKKDESYLSAQVDRVLKQKENDLEDAMRIRIATNAIEGADAVQGLLRLSRGEDAMKVELEESSAPLNKQGAHNDSLKLRSVKRRRPNGSCSTQSAVSSPPAFVSVLA